MYWGGGEGCLERQGDLGTHGGRRGDAGASPPTL